jgi:hypothetical protein
MMSEMGEKLKQSIPIPIWLFTLIMSMLFAIVPAYTSITAKAATLQEKVLKNEQQIEKKANQSDIDRVYLQLERIENKIDKITSK